MHSSKAHFKNISYVYQCVISSCLEWCRQGLHNQNLHESNQITVFLKTFGGIISSKIVRLAFWHWPLGLGSTRLNAQWPPLRHFQRFDLLQYIITYHLIHGNIFWNFGIFKNFVGIFLESLRILFKLFGIFSIQKFSEISKFYSETLVPA